MGIGERGESDCKHQYGGMVMTSKQLKLLLVIMGVCAIGLLWGYWDIVSQYGIDAPFEDFTNNGLLVKLYYLLNRVWDIVSIWEDGSFRIVIEGCIPFQSCN